MNTVEGPCLLGYALQFTINSLKFLEKLFNKPVYALLGKVHCPKVCSSRNAGPIQHGQVVNEFGKRFTLHNLNFPIYSHIFKTLKSATVSLLKFVPIFHGSSYFPWNTPLAQGVGDATMSLFN